MHCITLLSAPSVTLLPFDDEKTRYVSWILYRLHVFYIFITLRQFLAQALVDKDPQKTVEWIKTKPIGKQLYHILWQSVSFIRSSPYGYDPITINLVYTAALMYLPQLCDAIYSLHE